MKYKRTAIFAVLILSVAAVAFFVSSDDSDAATDPTYGTSTDINIAPGMRFTYKPTYPSDLSVTTVVEVQKQGSLSGSSVNIASMSSGTLIVNIPSNAAAGDQYHIVLKATSSKPSQTAYIYIVFNVLASLTTSGSQSNVVVGSAVDFTPTATGMGTMTWSVKSGTTLPEGLSLNTSTGKVTGIVSSVGSKTISLTCTSSYGETSDLTVTFNVVSKLAPTNSPSNGSIIYEV
ncbi:putative Ig domain protein [Thermoplasmatales archaeon BRNA1]|nr:putative Ig domain protein [Thermoplasmatales archaeon BRNA1]